MDKKPFALAIMFVGIVAFHGGSVYGQTEMNRCVKPYEGWILQCQKIRAAAGVPRAIGGSLNNYIVVQEFHDLTLCFAENPQSLITLLKDFVAGKSPNPKFDFYLYKALVSIYGIDEPAVIGRVPDSERAAVLADHRKYVALMLESVPSGTQKSRDG